MASSTIKQDVQKLTIHHNASDTDTDEEYMVAPDTAAVAQERTITSVGDKSIDPNNQDEEQESSAVNTEKSADSNKQQASEDAVTIESYIANFDDIDKLAISDEESIEEYFTASDEDPEGVFAEEYKKLDYVLVDNKERMNKCIELINESVRKHPLLALDCEGERLSRKGKLYLISVATRTRAYLIDVKVLKTMPFEMGLRDILEDANVKKLMFDCREDSDALYHQFQVKLDGVLDIQLLEVIKENAHLIGITSGRRCDRNDEVVRLKSLLYCISWYVKDKQIAERKWKGVAQSSDWEKRPLLQHELEYAKTDVISLFKLLDKFQPNQEEMGRLGIASEIYVDMKRSIVYRTYSDYENNCYLPVDVIPPKGQTQFEKGHVRCMACNRPFPWEEFSKNQIRKGLQKCRTCKRVKLDNDVHKQREEQLNNPIYDRIYTWDCECKSSHCDMSCYYDD